MTSTYQLEQTLKTLNRRLQRNKYSQTDKIRVASNHVKLQFPSPKKPSWRSLFKASIKSDDSSDSGDSSDDDDDDDDADDGEVWESVHTVNNESINVNSESTVVNNELDTVNIESNTVNSELNDTNNESMNFRKSRQKPRVTNK